MMATKVIKEIIIMLVVCLLTMLVLAIALYQYIPSKKIVPEISTYTASEDVQDLLEDDIDSRTNKDKVILTYEVTSSDLNNYQTTKDYVPGKSNPFSAYVKTYTGEDGEENQIETKDTKSEETTGSTSKESAPKTQSSEYSQNTGIK